MQPDAETPPETVGTRVREARQRTGISGRALAARVGLSPTAISKIESGRTESSIDTLRRIADELGVGLPWLLGSDDEHTVYREGTIDQGFLERVPRDEWPQWILLPPPEYWPGSLREFVNSASAAEMQLRPVEVPLLAAAAVAHKTDPQTAADWLMVLSMLRALIGSGGRPVRLEVVKHEGGSDDGRAGTVER